MPERTAVTPPWLPELSLCLLQAAKCQLRIHFLEHFSTTCIQGRLHDAAGQGAHCLMMHVCLFLASALLALTLAAKVHGEPAVYTYEIVAEYPHDPSAFTQGIEHDKLCNDTRKECYDIFWESTGLNGQSSVRLVEAVTGKVQRKADLHSRHFAEGLARLGNKLYQITWRSGEGLIYSVPDLKKVGDFKTELGDGWGLTSNGTHLIATESSPTVHFIDPATYKTVHKVTVKDGDHALRWVNELEMVEGELWGNIWQTECIVRVDLTTGSVLGYILMHGLRSKTIRANPRTGAHMDVLNGIAYDASTKRLWMTGKLWPTLYEVRIKPHPKPPSREHVKTSCWAGA